MRIGSQVKINNNCSDQNIIGIEGTVISLIGSDMAYIRVTKTNNLLFTIGSRIRVEEHEIDILDLETSEPSDKTP